MKRWTKEEKQAILKEVSSHPENLQKCFLTLSTKLNRSQGAISQMWYFMQNPTNPHYIGTKTMFVLLGKDRLYRGKNYTKNSLREPIKVKQNLLYKIKIALKKLWNLK